MINNMSVNNFYFTSKTISNFTNNELIEIKQDINEKLSDIQTEFDRSPT